MNIDDARAVLARERSVQSNPALDRLVRHLCERHGEAVNAVLYYGSCLRSGDLFDGLVDLYLVVDSYSAFYARRRRALANWLLPPNVFYVELAVGEKVLRAKYAVLSSRDLAHATSTRWFHSYIWGRFTQPTAIAWTRDDQARQGVEDAFVTAGRTFLARVLPRLPARGTVRDLWQQGLLLSYSAELRVEKAGRSGELVEAAREYYEALTMVSAGSMKYPLELIEASGGMSYTASVPMWSRAVSRVTWPLRSAQGKILSVLRLVKGLFTFDGGLDYIAWKLERHSGRPIEIPERVRRHPLIFVWGLFWRLYREGVFR